jgi:hypothetical protein
VEILEKIDRSALCHAEHKVTFNRYTFLSEISALDIALRDPAQAEPSIMEIVSDDFPVLHDGGFADHSGPFAVQVCSLDL